MNTAINQQPQGFYLAVCCYSMWGLFPLYWAPLNHAAIPAQQILAQRIVWSALFSIILLLIFTRSRPVIQALTQPKIIAIFFISACLIGINWFVYLWALMNHHILDASLGYLINPLFNILLGTVFFRESSTRIQKIAIALAAIGILWLAIPLGHTPWVALLLSLSFGGYGLMRKIAPIDALSGLVLETLFLLPIAAGYLWWCATQQQLVFTQLTLLQTLILIGSGVATTVPLLMFAGAAKRISLSLLGILQYISPSLHILLGLFLFHEQLSQQEWIAYTWVWLGVILFLYDAYKSVQH